MGEECWCRIITTKDPVYWHPDITKGYRDEDECISPAGSIPKEVAEHIVELHNEHLRKTRKQSKIKKLLKGGGDG